MCDRAAGCNYFVVLWVNDNRLALCLSAFVSNIKNVK